MRKYYQRVDVTAGRAVVIYSPILLSRSPARHFQPLCPG